MSGCVCLRRFRLFNIEVSRLESIDRHGIIAVVDGNGETFVSSFEDAVCTIIRWLEGFANCIMSDEDMCGSRESMRNVAVPMSWSGWRGSD